KRRYRTGRSLGSNVHPLRVGSAPHRHRELTWNKMPKRTSHFDSSDQGRALTWGAAHPVSIEIVLRYLKISPPSSVVRPRGCCTLGALYIYYSSRFRPRVDVSNRHAARRAGAGGGALGGLDGRMAQTRRSFVSVPIFTVTLGVGRRISPD